MKATQETTRLQKTLLHLRGCSCPDCGQNLCDHQILCAIALGLKDSPRCPICAARGLSRNLDAMRTDLTRFLRAKDCFAGVWKQSDPRFCQPHCPWESLLGTQENAEEEIPDTDDLDDVLPENGSDADSQNLPVHDFGDMACGDLVLELRKRIRELPSGTAIRVIATDPGAPEDIPAWTRLCGHTLLRANPPRYDLRKGN